VPIRTVGPPLGLMIVGEHGGDRHLLGVGRGIEAALNRTL
jgi:Asp-tRNA(Asn)/Glu-tRNA(Gln) amidotransferase A subunit family amidase